MSARSANATTRRLASHRCWRKFANRMDILDGPVETVLYAGTRQFDRSGFLRRKRQAYHVVMDRIQAMRVFVTVLDERSLSAAAEKLGMSLPTVSRILSSLERE